MAVVLSIGTLVAMSAFGGVGYANFGFQFNPFPSHSSHSPFKDEYGKGGKKGHKHHSNNGNKGGNHYGNR
ncbi:MAG: hypothetical protein ACRDQE_16890 [Gaiellales bacterium]